MKEVKQPCGESDCLQCPYDDCVLSGNNTIGETRLESIQRKMKERETLGKWNTKPIVR